MQLQLLQQQLHRAFAAPRRGSRVYELCHLCLFFLSLSVSSTSTYFVVVKGNAPCPESRRENSVSVLQVRPAKPRSEKVLVRVTEVRAWSSPDPLRDPGRRPGRRRWATRRECRRRVPCEGRRRALATCRRCGTASRGCTRGSRGTR